jgi:DNA-binding FadR family transcriptional regulator
VFQPIGDEGRAALVERRIAEAIMGGVLSAGERLPAETELAAAFGVAPATAREALLALRKRGLIVTRRGRNGGSFIADSADPVHFASRTVLDSSRVSLRDAAQHYLAITAACVELAARRADPGEIAMIRTRLERVDDSDLAAWRRASDDAVIELAALSQSARLTREQMKLQGEFSPLLALIDTDRTSRRHGREQLLAVLAEVERGDAAASVKALRLSSSATVEWLIAYREHHGSAATAIPPTPTVKTRTERSTA